MSRKKSKPLLMPIYMPDPDFADPRAIEMELSPTSFAMRPVKTKRPFTPRERQWATGRIDSGGRLSLPSVSLVSDDRMKRKGSTESYSQMRLPDIAEHSGQLNRGVTGKRMGLRKQFRSVDNIKTEPEPQELWGKPKSAAARLVDTRAKSAKIQDISETEDEGLVFEPERKPEILKPMPNPPAPAPATPQDPLQACLSAIQGYNNDKNPTPEKNSKLIDVLRNLKKILMKPSLLKVLQQRRL